MWQIVATLPTVEMNMPPYIAIVEDEPALRENYADAFRRQSYRVETFESRKQALIAFGESFS